MPREESFLHQMIRGAIGKEFVIKHYRRGRIFRTKYPDMTPIVATEKQRACRNKFREAVAWAKEYISDQERKDAYKPWFRQRKRVFNQLIKDFMLKEKKAKAMAERLTDRLIWLAMRKVPGAIEEEVVGVELPAIPPLQRVNRNLEFVEMRKE